MDTKECIKKRRSIRKYSNKPVKMETIKNIINLALMAPSGNNNQPWRVRMINDKILINKVANLVTKSIWIKEAPCYIVVYLDKTRTYDFLKDMQGCGAFIQTILLAAYDMGLGSCWVGEVANHKKNINSILNIDSTLYELIGIITIGYTEGKKLVPKRRTLNEVLL